MRIRRTVVDGLIAHARDSAPNECCGLLVGAAAEIVEAVRTRNIEEGPVRYRVDPHEHIALMKRLRGSNHTIVGAYHSHPRSPAIPSASDLSEAFYPDFVYVIVSLESDDRPDCRAWRIRNGTAEEIKLSVDPVAQPAADAQ